ncbi:MAG TPA: ABC transporter permease [Puia sp.]|nr:ABC transporter permease [Puia sp.]
MIKNWLRTALRNIRRNPTSSLINIFGLTIGLSSCLLITLFIRHELSYDNFETRGPRIARVIMGYRFDGGGDMRWGNFTSTKVAPTFKRNFPEIETAVRMYKDDRTVSYRDKLFTEKMMMYADSSFFDVFSFGLLKGDIHTALNGPKKIIVTESAARRYFGNEEPIGKLLRVGTDSVTYEVTGLMADVPSNSQFKFDFLASFSSLYANQEETYYNANYGTFLLLRDKGSFATLQPKVTAFMKKEMAGKGATIDFLLEPFSRIHLYSEYVGFEPGTSIIYIYILGGVALLILIIACSTYINLSTARSVERAREVGVRKVIGAGKGQLFWQFIGESFLLCLIAVVLSLGVVLLVLPAFNKLSDRVLPAASLFSLPFLGLSLGIAVIVSLLAGSYPALILAKFQPVKVLKGAFKNTRSGQGLRQSLIVFQFVISVFLIVSTFIMQRQLSYIRNKKLGYERDHVLVLPVSRKMSPKIDYIKTTLTGNRDILSVSHSSESPVSIMGGYNMRSAAMPEDQQLAVTACRIDEDFIRTTGLQLIAGEDLSKQDMRDANPEFFAATEGGASGAAGAGRGSGAGAGSVGGADSAKEPLFHFILNESAARQLGWTPKEAIGKRMFLDATRPGFVKGVVKDFNFESLHNPIRSLVLFPDMHSDKLLVRVTGQHMPEMIRFLETKWKDLVPYIPFEYHFLDEDYNRIYSSELRLGQVMNLFSGIAIVLACLGLFGLSSYAAKQRVKEIGIRKVLGASLTSLAVLLSANFIRLALVAICIAYPLSWWAMRRWLQAFVYRTDIDWKTFVLAGLMVMVVTLATVSIQAVKTALLNPVRNLKND